jgi:hypothetical protein
MKPSSCNFFIVATPLKKRSTRAQMGSLNLLLGKFAIMMTFIYPIKTRVHKQEQVI